jgi:UDP-glucose 4-epimerase
MGQILVTGGAGYIGSHVVYRLIERGYSVVVFDNLSAGHRAALHPQAEFVQGDLLDRTQIAALFAGHTFDGIMHFASRIQVGESMQKPFLYLRENIDTAQNIIEAACEHGVKRFILSSTANLFDQPNTIPIAENEPIIPGSVYGETKAHAERILYWMDRIYGLKYCALRYFNASGAHPDGLIGEDHHPETHLIPLVLQVALGQRDSVTVFGDDYATHDGTPIRDYIHVMDLADAHILQRRHWPRLHRDGSHPDRARDHRPCHPRDRRGAPGGRCVGAGGRQYAHHGRAELDAAVQRPAQHHRDGLEMAPEPSAWLR